MEKSERVLYALVLGAIVALVWLVVFGAQVAAVWEIGTSDVTHTQINEYRRSIVQLLGALAVALGLILTYRRIRASERRAGALEEQIALTEAQVRISEEGQVTERFTRAIDQLGSDKPRVRLGGIYALSRIAGDSEKDHWTVVQVLSAFVKDALREEEEQDEPSRQADEQRTVMLWSDDPGPQLPGTDVQAALSTIEGRNRERDPEDGRINLVELYAPRIEHTNAKLERATLRSAYLEGSDLMNSTFEEADLWEADLSGANVRRTNFRSANLVRAYLVCTDFQEANLEGADLFGAIATQARFKRANLNGANLSDATLNSATFEEADLSEADLRRTHELTVEQLAASKTLHNARLDPELEEAIRENYPELLKQP